MCSHPAAEFSIWTREAGAGGLSIAVEGPSKAEITFEDRKDGSCGASYVVQEPGEQTLKGACRGTFIETFYQINRPSEESLLTSLFMLLVNEILHCDIITLYTSVLQPMF